jgi:hypothetical protein
MIRFTLHAVIVGSQAVVIAALFFAVCITFNKTKNTRCIIKRFDYILPIPVRYTVYSLRSPFWGKVASLFR